MEILHRLWPLGVNIIATLAASGFAHPSLTDLTALALGYSIYRHDSVTRWRPISTLIMAVAFSGTMAVGISTTLEALGGEIRWGLPAYFLFPLPAHAIVRLANRGLSKNEYTLTCPAGSLRRFQAAIRETPWIPYRFIISRNTGERPFKLSTNPNHCPSAILDKRSIQLAPEGPEEGMGHSCKRTMDLVLATMGLPIVLPVLAILGLLVLKSSGSPAYYSQTRVTKNGRIFPIFKLRTMILDAEPSGRPTWPMENDPRITPLGRFLRRFWLDELPQILNVIQGTLSWVGPRPERPYFVSVFSDTLPNYPKRHRVRAGITGLAQVSGLTGNTSIARRLVLDIRYQRLWSPWLDLKILVGTVFRALRRPPIRPTNPESTSGSDALECVPSLPKQP